MYVGKCALTKSISVDYENQHTSAFLQFLYIKKTTKHKNDNKSWQAHVYFFWQSRYSTRIHTALLNVCNCVCSGIVVGVCNYLLNSQSKEPTMAPSYLFAILIMCNHLDTDQSCIIIFHKDLNFVPFSLLCCWLFI